MFVGTTAGSQLPGVWKSVELAPVQSENGPKFQLSLLPLSAEFTATISTPPLASLYATSTYETLATADTFRVQALPDELSRWTILPAEPFGQNSAKV